MNVHDIQAIDVHAHCGIFFRNDAHELINQFMSGSADVVAQRAAHSNIMLTVVSPLEGLFPRGLSIAETEKANQQAHDEVAANPALRQWVIIDPRKPETYQQADRMLQTPCCVGIKIHGEEHQYHIEDYGDAIFEFAAEHDAVVLAHSGDVHTEPMRFVPFADRYEQVKLIVAHIGHNHVALGDPGAQIRAIEAARHGNIWADTSSAKSIMPHLIEWSVKRVGPEKILFGTDTPIYFTANQRARIDCADIGDDAKQMILRDNAMKLLQL
jgi:predicted TIM-barrel fold metal-dependent hydrolase